MSNIDCPKCGLPIPGARVNIATGIAHCEACDRVFRFDDQVPPKRAARSSSTALAVVVKPNRFVVTGGDLVPPEEVMYRTTSAQVATPLVIRWRWFGPKAIFATAFAIGWDSFLVVWYWNAIVHGGPAIMFIFPLIHLAVGFWVTYLALSSLFNTTTITMDADEIRSVTSPIRNPFKGDAAVPRGALAEIGVLEKRGNKGAVSYRVVARDDAGRAHELATFDERHEADYVTQRLRQQIDMARLPESDDEALLDG